MSETKDLVSTRLVPTNLPGVYSQERIQSWASGPPGLTALLPPEALARLQASEEPGPRRFLELLTSRRWRPEDQIIPVMTPQPGVTHLLTPPTPEIAPALNFIGNLWAGGTIQGTFTDAVGIWRVPFVSKSAMPAGSDGGWNSSSWVGIDGTYGSNDVLQAGVQQYVAADGSTSYTPWYEWFVQGDTSPPYVFQTNIDNMEIQPGDEVFSGIYYVTQPDGTRQGRVLFGNTTRGHYFGIVLTPPNGATFSGNSVDWIMEAPNKGEPTTSLPAFSPVVFSTAFGSSSVGGSGDPATGDTNNIQGWGSILTSVTLKTFEVEIDYAPTWAHNLPSAAGGAVAAAPGTSPTSWYTTPENVQHIAYVGTDQMIHELFYFIGRGDGQWHHNLPNAAVGAPLVHDLTSPTSWYTTPENVQHIAYVGSDSVIHELFYFIGRGDGQWHHNVPGAAAQGVQVRPFTRPTSWYTTPENVQHIAFVGAADGLVHELFYVIGGDGQWRHNLPSAAAPAVKVRGGTSPTSWYTTPENVQHLAFVGAGDGLIHELFYFIGGDGQWRHNVPSAAQGAPPVMPQTSPTSWYTTPENVQHIAYVGADGLIHELFYFIGGDGHWRHNVPGAAAGAVPVLQGTSPTSWYTTPENVQHVAYVGTDFKVHELFYFIGRGDGQWHHNVPSLAPGAVDVLAATSPTSWYTTPENVQHIAYVATDQQIHELFYRIG